MALPVKDPKINRGFLSCNKKQKTSSCEKDTFFQKQIC